MIAPLKKLIVCLDHTDMDQELIENACSISKIAGTTQITFLNVIREFNMPEAVLKEFPHLMDKALDERKEEIKGLIENHFKCDVPTKIMVRQGGETKEILNNHKEWLHEFKEWDEAPKEGKLIGEKKPDNENDTLH